MPISIPLNKAFALYYQDTQSKRLLGVILSPIDIDNKIRTAISTDRGGYLLDSTFIELTEDTTYCDIVRFKVKVKSECNHNFIVGYYLELVEVY